jgi:rhodanese-related sulfurtransferase/DNA-binding transcriptional ArsR family regulator
MTTESLKEQVYRELSRVTHAISNPKRMELLDIIANKEWSVDELSKEVSMSVASTSQHLQVLKAAKLLNSRREGNFIKYSISDDSVLRLVSVVRELGFRKYAEVERLINDFKGSKNDLESITVDELLVRSRREKIMIIDVRPEDEYNAGHIKNALSIPLSQLKKRISELPKGKTIIAYCRGPLCVMAVEAVKMLKGKNLRAIRLEDGFTEWKIRQQDMKHTAS